MMANRVFILGAGFSKPAGMPTAVELTDILIDEATESGRNDEMKKWLDDLQRRIRRLASDQGRNGLNVEELFSYARFDEEIWRMQQQLCPVGRSDGETPWCRANDIDTWLSYLEDDLVELLWKKQAQCCLDSIDSFASKLRPGDVVLTFNYDTLLEHSLSNQNKQWHHGLQDTSATGIPVLKLHGSLDWIILDRNSGNRERCTLLFEKHDANAEHRAIEDNDLDYHQTLWRINADTNLDFSIQNRSVNSRVFGLAGLGANKPLHHLPGSGLSWAKAEGGLREADEVYVIGFSLSPFDTLARLYFGGAIQARHEERRSPLRVTVIDPYAEDLQSRFEQLFDVNVQPMSSGMEIVNWSELLE